MLRSPRRGDVWKFGFSAVFGLVFILQITNGFPFLAALFQNTSTTLEAKTLLQIITISMIIDQSFRLFSQKASLTGMMPYLILPFTRRSLVLFHESLALMTLYNLLTLIPPLICFLLSALLLGPSALLTGLALLLSLAFLLDHFLYRLSFLIPSQIIRWTVMISMIVCLFFFVQKISAIPPAILDFLSLGHLTLLVFVILICIAISTAWIYQSRLSPYDHQKTRVREAKMKHTKGLRNHTISLYGLIWRMLIRNRVLLINNLLFIFIITVPYFLGREMYSTQLCFLYIILMTFLSAFLIIYLFSWENSFYPLVHILLRDYVAYGRRALYLSCIIDMFLAFMFFFGALVAGHPEPFTVLAFASAYIITHGLFLPYLIWYNSKHLMFFSLIRWQPVSYKSIDYIRLIPIVIIVVLLPFIFKKLIPLMGAPWALAILALPGLIGFLFMKPVIRSAGRRYEQSKYTIFNLKN